MPFAEHFDWVFDRIIQPCADVTCADLIRIDLENTVGDISNIFRDELSKADCVLAIVTGERPNVLYEVGFAHAIGKEVLLLCQRDSGQMQTSDIPFYVRNHRTIWYPERYDEPGIAKVIEELCDTLRKV
jgi:hypothetical protein